MGLQGTARRLERPRVGSLSVACGLKRSSDTAAFQPDLLTPAGPQRSQHQPAHDTGCRSSAISAQPPLANSSTRSERRRTRPRAPRRGTPSRTRRRSSSRPPVAGSPSTAPGPLHHATSPVKGRSSPPRKETAFSPAPRWATRTLLWARAGAGKAQYGQEPDHPQLQRLHPCSSGSRSAGPGPIPGRRPARPLAAGLTNHTYLHTSCIDIAVKSGRRHTSQRRRRSAPSSSGKAEPLLRGQKPRRPHVPRSAQRKRVTRPVPEGAMASWRWKPRVIPGMRRK